MPRPKKMTKKVKREIIDLLKKGQTMVYICDLLRIDRATEWRERRDVPEWAAEVEEALTLRDEVVEDALYLKASTGDVTAARFWLLNRAAERWHSEQFIGQQVNVVTIPGGVVAISEVVVELPPVESEQHLLGDGIVDVEAADDEN